MIETITDNLSVLLVILPLFAAFLLPIFSRKAKFADYMAIAVGVLFFIGAGYLTVVVLGQNGTDITYSLGGWTAPWGIELWTCQEVCSRKTPKKS